MDRKTTTDSDSNSQVDRYKKKSKQKNNGLWMNSRASFPSYSRKKVDKDWGEKVREEGEEGKAPRTLTFQCYLPISGRW